jgi:hypothetical protein
MDAPEQGPGTQPGPGPATPPDDRSNRYRLVGGIFLIFIGVAFLLGRVVDLAFPGEVWPLWIVAIGVAMFIGSFIVRGQEGLGLAIPGAVVTTVGLILGVQEATDSYSTWAYAWALIPTAVGVALFAYSFVSPDPELRANGVRTFLTGLGLFIGFGLFFEGFIGLSGDRWGDLGNLLPIAAIVFGGVLVVIGLFGRRGAST